jgi:hypothetical protein
MPVFVCDNCDNIDNSACGGTFWTRNMDIWPEEYRGKALCVECAPKQYSDGSPNERAGKWHGRFPKRKATADMFHDGRNGFAYIGRFEKEPS